jgi:acetolactate synthase I/II/III large subunit
MASSRMTGAQFIARALKGYGLTHVFFVESILRQTLIELEALGIRRILTHSEAAAVYMADGYARASRRPGVCFAQSVGAANLAAALQDAYLGRSPVIAITGRKPAIAQLRNAYQEIQHRPLFSAVTKYGADVDSILQLPHVLPQAFREATSGTPRPVHLEVAGLMGELLENQEGQLEVVVEDCYTVCPSHRPLAEPDVLEEAARMITQASRPVIVAGGGAILSGAGEEILEIAESLGIPVAYSLDGKGIVPEDHPAAVGVVGSYSSKSANRVVSEADLVIFVGSDTGDQATYNWQIPRMGTKVVQVDPDPSELGRNYPGTFGILGDPKASIRGILGRLGRPVRKDPWMSRVQTIVKEWKDEMRPLMASDSVPIRVERLCWEITKRLAADAVLVSDTGYSGIWTGTSVPLTERSQTYLRSAGSLGWGFPASLGAKCAAPERPVVSFVGDGGFYYHLSELETAARWGIKTVTIVNNNSALGQCLVPVEQAYGGRSGEPSDLMRFRDVNFSLIAKAMGCQGIRVERPDEIGKALETAFAAHDQVVVDVVTDPRALAPAPWLPEP